MKYEKLCKVEIGQFYDISHYDKIISDTCYGLKENGDILFYLVKNNIKEENKTKYKNTIRSNAKSKTKNRGKASGACDISKFPKKAVALCDKDGNEYQDGKSRYSVYYKEASGKVVNRCQSNQVRCGVAGYFDKVAGLPCRKVGWSTKHPLKHNILIDLAREIEEGHKKYCPDSYTFHQKSASLVPNNLLFSKTIYSTMTLNYDFRTATHIDKGDLVGGLSTLTIFEDIPGNYEGFYLGLPEYKIAFDLRDGDTIYFDAHEIHANTEYKVLSDKLPIDDITGNPFAGRISVVCYLRNKLHTCKTLSDLVSECYKTDDLSTLQFDDCKEIKEFGVNDRESEYVKKFHEYFDSNKDIKEAYYNLIRDIVSKYYGCDVLYQKTPNIRLHQPESTSIGRRPNDPPDIIGLHSDNEFNHPKGEDNWIYALTDMFETNSLYYGETHSYKNVILKKDTYNMFNFNEIKHWNRINKTGKSRVSFDFRIMKKDIKPLKEGYYETFNF